MEGREDWFDCFWFWNPSQCPGLGCLQLTRSIKPLEGLVKIADLVTLNIITLLPTQLVITSFEFLSLTILSLFQTINSGHHVVRLSLCLFYCENWNWGLGVGILVQVKYCSENNKRLIHFSTSEVYGKTIGSFLPKDSPLRQVTFHFLWTKLLLLLTLPFTKTITLK